MKTFLGAAAIALAGCGGGGGGGGQTAGIDRGGRTPTEASGTVTGFGSVIVNGVRYSTANATFTVDGALATETDIQPGHVVSIAGEIDSTGARTATRVALVHDVEGPIESIDLLAQRLVVLGQTVTVDAATSFDAAIATRSLLGLGVGTSIEVSGFRAADGVLRGSRIELDTDNDPYRVSGVLTGVDAAARSALLNGLTIDYRTATLEGFAAGQPTAGDFVLVEGVTLSGTQLVAARLVRSNSAPLDLAAAGTTAEVEGLITRLASSTDFDVDGQRVTTNPLTVLVRGSAAELVLGARVEVRGSGANGVLAATEVAFAPTITTRIQGDIDAVDIAGRSITVLGIVVRLLGDTTVEDARDDERVFDLADLRVGDQVEVYGYEDPPNNGSVAAVRLDREDDGGGAELAGVVRSVSDPEFRILTVRVLTTTDTEFDDLSRDELFASGVGRLIDVEGVYANGILTADEVEPAD
jgi:hypothetical protein